MLRVSGGAAVCMHSACVSVGETGEECSAAEAGHQTLWTQDWKGFRAHLHMLVKRKSLLLPGIEAL
jgi:hypothetical protein